MAAGRSRHRRAELFRGDGRRVGVRDQPAAVHDAQGVGEPDQLVQVGGDQQHCQTLATRLADLVPDLRLRADVHAPGGVRGDQQLRGVAHLAADDQLLLVAAGERGRGDLDAGGADVVLAHDPLGVRAGRLEVEERALAVGPLGDMTEDAVLPERGLKQQSVPVAVLRDDGHAVLPALARRGSGDVGAVQAEHTVVEGAHAHDGVDQFGLAVALDARDAEDLALVDGEGDAVEHGTHHPVRVGGGQSQVVDGEHRRVGDGRLAGLRRRQLAADHQLGELLGRGVRRVGGAHRRTAPDHRDLVGDGEDLAELVRDEDDGQAFGLELAQVVEECVDLLRHEDGGRLVEDQRAGTAVEDLEDLHALAVGDAEVLDHGVRTDAEAVRVGDLLDPGAGPVADPEQLLGAEDDVLQDGQVVGEHEVLVHHADAACDGVAGVVERDLLAVHRDGALVRLLHAVQDLHQSGLAGAVLADKSVDGAAAHGDVDVVVGHDPGEPLGDAAELHGMGTAGRVDDALSLAGAEGGGDEGGGGEKGTAPGGRYARSATESLATR